MRTAELDARVGVVKVLLQYRWNHHCGWMANDVVTALLQHKAGQNQATPANGRSSLCMAAMHGHVDVVITTLLQHNADPSKAATDILE